LKLHINIDDKTIAIEGQAKVATIFNYLMSWFAEDWENWSFIPFVPTIQYKEIIVEKEIQKNPYWNPWGPTYASGIDTGTPMLNPSYTTSTTLNFKD